MEQEKNKVLQVNVVTPDGNVYDHNATIVVAKTVAGEIGILPNHAPIIAPLAIDEVRVRRTDSDTHVDWIAVNGGIMDRCLSCRKSKTTCGSANSRST